MVQRTASSLAKGAHRCAMSMNAGWPACQALASSWSLLTCGSRACSNTSAVVTRAGSLAGPCTRTFTPRCARLAASRAVRLGSLRAPLYEGSKMMPLPPLIATWLASSRGRQRAWVARTNPCNSLAVSPLMRMARQNAPTSRSVTWASRIWPSRSADCSASRGRAPSLPRPMTLMYAAMLMMSRSVEPRHYPAPACAGSANTSHSWCRISVPLAPGRGALVRSLRSAARRSRYRAHTR